MEGIKDLLLQITECRDKYEDLDMELWKLQNRLSALQDSNSLKREK